MKRLLIVEKGDLDYDVHRTDNGEFLGWFCFEPDARQGEDCMWSFLSWKPGGERVVDDYLLTPSAAEELYQFENKLRLISKMISNLGSHS